MGEAGGCPQICVFPCFFLFFLLNSPSFVTTSFLAGVARLQAALGPPGIRKCHIHPNPLGAHLEARHCPVQQVSVSSVTRGWTHPRKFSLLMRLKCFLQLFHFILVSVVRVHVGSIRCLKWHDWHSSQGFALLTIPPLGSQFCWGMPVIVFSSHVRCTIKLDLSFQSSSISFHPGALP